MLMRRENMLNLESDGVGVGAGNRLLIIPRCFPEGNDAAHRKSRLHCWTRSGPG
jgi:hypothetical protein